MWSHWLCIQSYPLFWSAWVKVKQQETTHSAFAMRKHGVLYKLKKIYIKNKIPKTSVWMVMLYHRSWFKDSTVIMLVVSSCKSLRGQSRWERNRWSLCWHPTLYNPPTNTITKSLLSDLIICCLYFFLHSGTFSFVYICFSDFIFQIFLFLFVACFPLNSSLNWLFNTQYKNVVWDLKCP